MQFGGQTPLNLARALAAAGVPIIGTSVDTIEAAEDREKFQQIAASAESQATGQWHRPHHGSGSGRSRKSRLSRPGPTQFRARWTGDGNLLRPSAIRTVCRGSIYRRPGTARADRSLSGRCHRSRCRRHLPTARRVVVAGIMEHIEEAGVHSGDSACAFRPTACPHPWWRKFGRPPSPWRKHLKCRRLMNVQFAVKKEDGQCNVYVLEVNPRPAARCRLSPRRRGCPSPRSPPK